MVNSQLSNQLQMLFLVSMQEGKIWEVFQIMGKIFPTLPNERKLSTNIYFHVKVEEKTFNTKT